MMRPVPPARSRRAVPLPNVEAPAAVQALHVTIPLKPQQTPTALPPRLTQAVKDEFAIRYLRQIGANSTPENVAMVLQHLPLEKCVVSAAWKSRGSFADVLAIDLNPKSLTQAGEPPAKGGGGAGATAKTETDTTSIAALLLPRRRLRGQQTRHAFQIGSVCFTFDDMKRKFLLPFKLANPPPEPDVLQLYGTHLEPGTGLADTQSSNQVEQLGAVPGSPIALGTIAKWETLRRHKSVDERCVPPNAGTETVFEMHNEFYLALPLTSLGLPGGDEDTRTVLYEALLSPAMVELVQSTMQYLFFTVIHPQTTAKEKGRTSTEQDALFVSIAQRFAMLRVKMERKRRSTPRPQLAVLVPLLLLALRVDIETLVRLQYPVSFSCAAEEMARLLQALDTRISQLLDPDANWSRLAVLETTHEASQARASSTFQHARRHRRLRDQFFQTSAVLHDLFPDPSSGTSRRVMTLRGGAGISHYPDLSNDAPESAPSTSSSPAAKQEERRLSDTVSVASKLSLLQSLRRSQQT
ncbi:hypothetical protein PHYPSEUDO_000022 [Phytophthora pseudosyringae]|uniref:Uncharacterized protein n=1 Tax=Phytophthora pseudosyringae TaxID=221518 RepID=A0A8T1WKP2_9STRA|nr:hypothetical protein PHYPSEUDO_000022 [Phytophthora pseudosyringae]